MLKTILLAAVAVATCAAVPAAAVVVSGTLDSGSAKAGDGYFINVTNPAGLSVGNNNFQDNNVRAFNEAQLFTLTSLLRVNDGSNIARGTRVRSHYVVFDPGPTRTAAGTVTFNTPVLGLIYSTARLGQSDFLSNPLVNYLNPSARGLENGTDSVGFLGRTVSYSLRASSPGDSFRVITAAVPEPGTWMMLLGGFGMIGMAARRRSNVASVLA